MTQFEKGRTVRRIAFLGLMTALTLLLHMMGAFLRFGFFEITPVLVPIAIGAIVCGPFGGAWLGGVSAMYILLSGQAAFFLNINSVGTVITVLAKGILCGLVAGVLYNLLEKKNSILAVTVAALACPIVNTGIFFLGCLAFFLPTLAAEAGEQNVLLYIITVYIGGNFIFELVVNLIFCPIIGRLIKLVPYKNGKFF